MLLMENSVKYPQKYLIHIERGIEIVIEIGVWGAVVGCFIEL